MTARPRGGRRANAANFGRVDGNFASVGRILVEPESAVKENPCASCAGTNRLLHGYVYEDGDAHGIYFAEWCDGDHPHRAVFLTLGLGAFGEDTALTERQSFAIEWREEGMALLDEPVRDRPDLLGEFVAREAALELPMIDHVWYVADHLVLDDQRLADLRAWLDAP